MPYKDRQTSLVSHRERQRRYRARVKECRAKPTPALPQDTPPGDLVDAVASWAAETLKVPSGHKLAGEAMEIPAYGMSFLRDVMGGGVREGLLCTARKNGNYREQEVILAPGQRLRIVDVRRDVDSAFYVKKVDQWVIAIVE